MFQLDRCPCDVGLGLAHLVLGGQPVFEQFLVAAQGRSGTTSSSSALTARSVVRSLRLRVRSRSVRRLSLRLRAICSSSRATPRRASRSSRRTIGVARLDLGARAFEDLDDPGRHRRGEDLLEAGNDEARGVEGRVDLAADDDRRANPVPAHRGAKPTGDQHHARHRDESHGGRYRQTAQLATALLRRVDQSVHGVDGHAEGRSNRCARHVRQERRGFRNRTAVDRPESDGGCSESDTGPAPKEA